MPPAVSEVELVNLRVLVSAHVDRLRSAVPAAVTPGEARSRRVFFAGTGFVDVPVRDRAALSRDEPIEGPAIVEQVDSTTIVPPGATVRVGEIGELMIRV